MSWGLKPWIVGLLAILIFAVPCFAQTKTLTLESVRERAKRATALLSKTPFRVTTTIEVRNSETEEWRPYSCFITENAAGRSHGRRCAEPLRETIRSGKDTYIRMPDGSWRLSADRSVTPVGSRGAGHGCP